MPDLFPEPTNSLKSKLQSAVHRLAAEGILIGTSSWKYPGWTGQIYDEQRYCYRGKFAESRFERDCLVEYAEVFKTVCVDAYYYQFPSAKYLNGLVEKLIAKEKQQGKKAFIYVNNRLEGNALETINAMVEGA